MVGAGQKLEFASKINLSVLFFMPNSYLFTAADHAALIARREALSVEVRELGRTIGEAAAQGESFAGHDNAPQQAAEEDQRLRKAQLKEMESWLAGAVICKPEVYDGSIKFGSVILVEDLSSGEKTWYQVGSFWTAHEGKGTANNDAHHLMYGSPFARNLMTKRAGQTAEFKVGNTRTMRLKVIEVPDPATIPPPPAPAPAAPTAPVSATPPPVAPAS